MFVLRKEFVHISANIQCGFTLKCVHYITRIYSQMHRPDKYSEHSSIIWPVSANGWVFVYELSGCLVKSSWKPFCLVQTIPLNKSVFLWQKAFLSVLATRLNRIQSFQWKSFLLLKAILKRDLRPKHQPCCDSVFLLILKRKSLEQISVVF